jgi:hypothetical protein
LSKDIEEIYFGVGRGAPILDIKSESKEEGDKD